MTEATKEAEQVRSFTSDKLEWMNALSADPRVTTEDFEVGFCIAQHVNRNSGKAILSDETISEKTHVNRRSVQRSRTRLKKLNWITWQRTKIANIYQTLDANMNSITDHQLVLKEAREDRRKRRRRTNQDTPEVANLNRRKAPEVASRDVPKVA